MPVTGEMAPYGAEGVIAARIALEHARGAYRQCRLTLQEQDSASDPNQANIAAATLLSPPNSVQVIGAVMVEPGYIFRSFRPPTQHWSADTAEVPEGLELCDTARLCFCNDAPPPMG